MVDTDDKITEETAGPIAEAPVAEAPDAEETPAPDAADEAAEAAVSPAPDAAKKPAAKTRDGAFTQEVIALSVKAVAVALSLVMLILSILTVAMPLSAMRVFNKLGMYERALTSGERYIRIRLDEHGADTTDMYGNFSKVSVTQALADADMIEALDVSVGLSYKLLKENPTGADAKYFAQKLERNSRIYLALYGIGDVNKQKSRANLAALTPTLYPFEYDYTHNIIALNYAARTYTGDTANMLYNENNNGIIKMTTATERAQKFNGLLIDNSTPKASRISNISEFCDYIAQLGKYLEIVQTRFGVDRLLTESNEDKALVSDKMKGDEFSLFITAKDGFSPIFNGLFNHYDEEDVLPTFTKWVQLAVDFVPENLDEQLMQLYWLQNMASMADRVWNLGKMLYYNRSVYGTNSVKILEYYNPPVHAFDYCREKIQFKGERRFITSVYNELMAQYLIDLGVNTAA